MRLIDADKLPYINKVILVDELDGDIIITIAKEYTSYVNDETPTVKAIPIEELFRFIDSRAVRPDGTVKYTDDLTHLKTFISEWRMENEEGYRDEVNRWWAEHSSRFD